MFFRDPQAKFWDFHSSSSMQWSLIGTLARFPTLTVYFPRPLLNWIYGGCLNYILIMPMFSVRKKPWNSTLWLSGKLVSWYNASSWFDIQYILFHQIVTGWVYNLIHIWKGDKWKMAIHYWLWALLSILLVPSALVLPWLSSRNGCTTFSITSFRFVQWCTLMASWCSLQYWTPTGDKSLQFCSVSWGATHIPNLKVPFLERFIFPFWGKWSQPMAWKWIQRKYLQYASGNVLRASQLFNVFFGVCQRLSTVHFQFFDNAKKRIVHGVIPPSWPLI